MDKRSPIAIDDIVSTILSRYGFEPKVEQVDALEELLIEKRDVILIARTGFGKSIIFQAAPLMHDTPRIALIIMPLKALQNQQCQKLNRIDGCTPFVLNGDTNRQANLQAIAGGYYTHG